MWRRTEWLAVVLLLAGAPGCLGGGGQDVGGRAEALTLEDAEANGGLEELANELATDDCVDAARTAADLGHEVIWQAADRLGEIALLQVDGILACAAPTAELDPGIRARIVLLGPVRQSRPDPEPADPKESRPDPEPATPDEARPDPEPASPDEARPDPEPATPDESRPDPEPAGGGTNGDSSS